MPEVKKDSDNNTSKQLGAKLDNNLDSKILNKGKKNNNSSVDKKNAAFLKKEKKGGIDAEKVKSSGNLKKDKKNAEKKKSKLSKKVDKTKKKIKEALKKFSANILQFCWKYLIPSWGATVILLDIYVILRLTPLSFFLSCKLGEEWVAGKSGGADIQFKGAKGKKSKEVKMGKKALNLAETLLLLVINILVIGIILIAIAIIMFLVYIYTHPWEAYAMVGEAIVNLIIGS